MTFIRSHSFLQPLQKMSGSEIVFTKNKYWSGIRNGTMGTIIELNSQTIRVKLDKGKGISGKELSFAPNLNPHFDHGWVITIHKSQGTTVDLKKGKFALRFLKLNFRLLQDV